MVGSSVEVALTAVDAAEFAVAVMVIAAVAFAAVTELTADSAAAA